MRQHFYIKQHFKLLIQVILVEPRFSYKISSFSGNSKYRDDFSLKLPIHTLLMIKVIRCYPDLLKTWKKFKNIYLFQLKQNGMVF